MFKYIFILCLIFSNLLVCKDDLSKLLKHQIKNINLKRNSNKYVIGPWPGGLGVNIHSVLNHLVHCELNNKIPVVYWGSNSFYYNSTGFNGARNVWEYYFEPTSNLTYHASDRIHSFQEKDFGKFSYYDTSQEKRDKANELFKKYIKIKPVIEHKVDQFYDLQMAGKKTIGIHLRGTDKVTENKLVTPETIIEEALKYADEETQFLIASDEQKLLNKMIELLNGKKVIYYECYRSQDGSPLHIHRGKPSYAQLGEDVIVEMSLLARCDMFIRTLSSISAIVLYLNPKLNYVLLT